MSSKCLFMHELPQTLAETLHITTCFAPAGRQNKLQTNISPKKFRTISFWFFFKMKQHVNHIDELLPCASFFFAKSFPSPRWMMKILHIRWYLQVLTHTHRHIWNICINVTVDVRPSSHQTIGFYTLNPAPATIKTHRINPNFPAESAKHAKTSFWGLHQKGTKIPTPKSTWKWTYITWFF